MKHREKKIYFPQFNNFKEKAIHFSNSNGYNKSRKVELIWQ